MTDAEPTGAMVRTVCEALRAGAQIDTACEHAGISRRDVSRWVSRGRAELKRVAKTPRARVRRSERPFVQFLEETKEAIMAGARATEEAAAERRSHMRVVPDVDDGGPS